MLDNIYPTISTIYIQQNYRQFTTKWLICQQEPNEVHFHAMIHVSRLEN